MIFYDPFSGTNKTREFKMSYDTPNVVDAVTHIEVDAGKAEEFDLRPYRQEINKGPNYILLSLHDDLSFPLHGQFRLSIRDISPVEFYFELPVLIRAFVTGIEMQTNKRVIGIRVPCTTLNGHLIVPRYQEDRNNPFILSNKEALEMVRYCLPYVGPLESEQKKIPAFLRELNICSIAPDQVEKAILQIASEKKRRRKLPNSLIVHGILVTEKRTNRLQEYLVKLSGQ